MDDTELARWRGLAANRLDQQRSRAQRFQAYYDGEQDIPAILDTEERRAFQALLKESGADWPFLIVNAVAERLAVIGFRFAGADADAWAIWQASHMDADSRLVQRDALVMGSSFVMVQPSDANPTGVEITAESPLETTVLYEPGNRRHRVAGFKRFGDDDGQAVTDVLVLPDVIATWYPDEQLAEQAPNPAGEVGVIEIVPQPRTVGWPRSELTPALSPTDRITTLLFNRMVSADYGAFRQVWATGIRVARQTIATEDGETVRAVRPFDVGANRLLINEDPAGRFGSIPEAVLKGFLDSVQQDVEQLAAITQTPAHYLTGTLANLSADALKAAEAGLVAKIADRALFVGESWEEAMRFALRLTGNPAATDIAAEVVWRDFETRSLAQLADALVKLAQLGVPRRVLWEKWGATQQEIERWEQLAAAEQATAAASAASAFGAPDQAYARLLAAAGQTGAQ